MEVATLYKRALLFLSFLTLFAVPAFAGQWITKEVGWTLSNVGGSNGTSIVVRDTAKNVVAAGQADTSGSFSLNKAEVWRRHDGAATTVDTCVVGYLILQQDSLGVSASTLTSVTYEIDGRYAGSSTNYAANWTQVDSTVAKFVNVPQANAIVLPIRAISGLGSPDAELGGNYFYRIMAFDNLRVRITAAVGLMSSAKAYVRYWDNN